MILDAHCHAWARWPYQPAVPDPDSRGAAANLVWEMDRAGVERAVIICAAIGENADNNDYAAAQAGRFDGRLVPFADIDSRWSSTHHAPGAAARLSALVARLSPVGITHYMNEEADAGWLLSDEGLAFARAAERHNLILSLACGPFQVPVVAELAARVPGLNIWLHHLARVRADVPRAASGLQHVLDAAAQPNIFVKVSGLGYGVARGWEFPYAPMIEIFRAIFDRYGPARLLWGSDYPVCQRSFMTYTQALEVVRSCCTFLSTEDLEQIMGGTLAGFLAARES